MVSGHVTGSGRHVDEQDIQLTPGHVGPELSDGAGEHRAAPNHRLIGIFQQQVDGHHFDAHMGFLRHDAEIGGMGLLGQAEGFRDRGAGDIGIQYPYPCSRGAPSGPPA